MEERVGLQIAGEFEALYVDAVDGQLRPVYMRLRRPDAGPVLLFTARLSRAKSDLTLRPDFPLMLANAVRWLGGSTRRVYQSPATSDLVRIVPSPRPRELFSPDGQAMPLPAGQSLVGPLARAGLWTVTAAGESPETNSANPGQNENRVPPDAVMAVNLIDAAESDIRPRLDATPAVPERLLAGGPREPLWVWLVGLAALISLAEWYLYHRRTLV
jgi:hypothetical protein